MPHSKPPDEAAAANAVSGVGLSEELGGRERQQVGPPTILDFGQSSRESLPLNAAQ